MHHSSIYDRLQGEQVGQDRPEELDVALSLADELEMDACSQSWRRS
jgi:hypothetical protein